jgi:hypothetical protein
MADIPPGGFTAPKGIPEYVGPEFTTVRDTLVREADRAGVPVPLHRAMYRLVRARETA